MHNVPLVKIQGLCVSQISASVDTKPLLQDINLELHAGEVLGLIGPSGSGKSTLGLALLGYARTGTHISRGTVAIDGQNILSLSQASLQELRGGTVAYIAQSPASAFNPSIKIGFQVEEALVLHQGLSPKLAVEQAKALFAELDLPEPSSFGLRYPHQVSGGQLQRAMIAMALAGDPRLLIFDEPTTALDVTTQVEVLRAIKRTLSRHGVAAIYISHDLAVVAQVASQIALMENGSLQKITSVPDLISDMVAAQGPLPNKNNIHFLATTKDSVPVLRVQNVSAYYGRSDIASVHDVSLSVDKGQTVAIVGASGSGKTTLARTICGLHPTYDGEVFLSGVALPPSFTDRTREQLKNVQFVYQSADTALNPSQRVETIIGRALSPSEKSGISKRQRVIELLSLVGLNQDFLNRKPAQLSGGQKQRIGIARALAARPSLVVWDEVTSALDAEVADDILRLLKEVQERYQVAYVFISHDLDAVRRISDAIVVLKNGSVVESGQTSTVLTNPSHPYTRVLLASIPTLNPDWLTSTLSAIKTRTSA